jgi:type IV secretion system protein TrbI
MGMGYVSALAVALGYALQTHNKAGAGQELFSTQNRPSAEDLSGLPKDYRPAAPGAATRTGAAPNAAIPATTPDPELR